MPITAQKLRANLFRIFDEAIETGKPVEVIRKGVVLTIVPPKRVSKLDNLKKRKLFVGNSRKSLARIGGPMRTYGSTNTYV